MYYLGCVNYHEFKLQYLSYNKLLCYKFSCHTHFPHPQLTLLQLANIRTARVSLNILHDICDIY